MGKWLAAFLIAILAILGALYFYLYEPQRQDLQAARAESERNAVDLARTLADLEASRDEGEALKSRVADLESLLLEARAASADLEATKAELEAQLEAKQEELARLHQTHQELTGKLEQEIRTGEIQIRRIRDKLRVDLVDEILFASGEAEIKESGKEVLERVGDVLSNVSGRIIEVQGHTDDVPIVGRLAESYATNWELSAARAVNVVRFLQEEVGLDPAKLSAVAFSQYRPKASNETEKGRQQNRRIEILLSPELPKVAE